MGESPGIVAVTRFVRPGTDVFASYINYMDRDEAIHGGTVRGDYSAYEEMYMGNPEKTTGLFSADFDRVTPKTAAALKSQFVAAQKRGSLLWQTVVSFDNKWLEELGVYDAQNGVLDEARIQDMTRSFMSVLLERENMHLAVWTAAIHYNTDNIHVHIAIVDPAGERERKTDGKYAGEPKGTWNLRSIRYAKSAAVNSLMDLDKDMEQLNSLVRDCIVRSLREQGMGDTLISDDLNALLLQLEREEPDLRNWKYGMAPMAKYRSRIDSITDKWLEHEHSQEYAKIQMILGNIEKQQRRAYGDHHGKSYAQSQTENLYLRCGNAVLHTLREAEKERRRTRYISHIGRTSGVRVSRRYTRRLVQTFEDEYRHYKNLAAYDRQQKETAREREQEAYEQEQQIRDAMWLLENLEDY